MEKKHSSMQADAAVFSQLQAENAALKKGGAELRRKLERMNELRLNAQRARFGQSSEKRGYVLLDSEQIRRLHSAPSKSGKQPLGRAGNRSVAAKNKTGTKETAVSW